MKNKIIIIGAGASGLYAAIKASEKNYDITVLEVNEKPGKKILMTGNGRCNLTNMLMSSDFYNANDKEFVDFVLGEHNNTEVIKTFKNFGVGVKNKNNYIYPVSMQAGTVLSALISICNLRGIKIKTRSLVNKIRIDKNNEFIVEAYDINEAKNVCYKSEKLLIASGTKAGLKDDYSNGINKFLKDFGHNVYPYLPALCSLYIQKDKTIKNFLKNTKGVRCEIKCTLHFNNDVIRTSEGELQITDYGFSGIVIFQLSGLISRINKDSSDTNKMLCIDFLPSYTTIEILELFTSQIYYENKSLNDLFSGILNNKLAHELLLLYSARIDENVKPFNKCISLSKLEKIIKFIKNVPFSIEKTNDITFSQVCTGGIGIENITKNLESKLVKGLYFSGECIDVDGICGGYNLQWAWSTGYIAGRSMTND